MCEVSTYLILGCVEEDSKNEGDSQMKNGTINKTQSHFIVKFARQ